MLDALVPLLKVALYASTALLIGGLLFLALVWPDGSRSIRLRRLLQKAWIASLVSALGVVLVHGPYVLGGGFFSALSPEVIGVVAETNYGTLGWLRVGAIAVLGLVVYFGLGDRFEKPFQILAVAFGSGAVIATMSLSGHALGEGGLVVAVDMLHLFAAYAWLGGLVILVAVVLPTQRSEELAIAVPAFSTVAFTSVVLLAFTGTYHAVLQVGSLEGLTSTGYGRLLCLKLVAFSALLGLGELSRRWVRRRFHNTDRVSRRQDQEFRKGLRQSVMIEVGVAVVVLAVTAFLVTASPASHQEAALAAIGWQVLQ